MYTKYNDGKSGYLSQSVLPLYFGLGDATSVERVEVLWPSGKKCELSRDIAINKTLTISEPRSVLSVILSSLFSLVIPSRSLLS